MRSFRISNLEYPCVLSSSTPVNDAKIYDIDAKLSLAQVEAFLDLTQNFIGGKDVKYHTNN